MGMFSGLKARFESRDSFEDEYYDEYETDEEVDEYGEYAEDEYGYAADAAQSAYGEASAGYRAQGYDASPASSGPVGRRSLNLLPIPSMEPAGGAGLSLPLISRDDVRQYLKSKDSLSFADTPRSQGEPPQRAIISSEHLPNEAGWGSYGNEEPADLQQPQRVAPAQQPASTTQQPPVEPAPVPAQPSYQVPVSAQQQTPQPSTYEAPQSSAYQAPQDASYNAPQVPVYQVPVAPQSEQSRYVPSNQWSASGSQQSYGQYLAPEVAPAPVPSQVEPRAYDASALQGYNSWLAGPQTVLTSPAYAPAASPQQPSYKNAADDFVPRGEAPSAYPGGGFYQEQVSSRLTAETPVQGGIPAPEVPQAPTASQSAIPEDAAPAPSPEHNALYASDVVTGMPSVAIREMVVISPTSFEEAELIATALKMGKVVVINVRTVPDFLSRRIMDFAFGAASVSGASVGVVATKVYALTFTHALNEYEILSLRNRGAL